jgi:predicted transcriptional regulator
MSRKKNSGRPSTSTPTLHVVAEDSSSYEPATEAGKSLWAALLEHPDSSAAELAIAAGIGKSTAPKLLTQWLAEGRVTKTPGIARNGTRVADRWAIGAPIPETPADPTSTHSASTTVASDEPATESPTDTSDTPEVPGVPPADTVTADVATAPATDDSVAETGTVDTPPAPPGEKKGRLSKGALHGLVEDYFHEHSGETLGPSAISTKLQRSSGAVANACVRLVEKGVLVLAQDHPKRYALAAQD